MTFACTNASAQGERLVNRLDEQAHSLMNNNNGAIIFQLDANDFAGMHELDYGRYMYDKFEMWRNEFEEAYGGYFRLDRNQMVYTRVDEALFLVHFNAPVIIVVRNLVNFELPVSIDVSWWRANELNKTYFFRFFNELCKHHRLCGNLPWRVFYT